MRTLTLYRLTDTSYATYGRLETEQHKQICVTLEHPWRDENHDGLSDRKVSRIPAGTYRMFRRLSPKRHYEVFELEDVPARGNVQIHIGNVIADTDGCILAGTAFGEVKGEHGVTGSRTAFAALMRELADVDEAQLVVIDPPAPPSHNPESSP